MSKGLPSGLDLPQATLRRWCCQLLGKVRKAALKKTCHRSVTRPRTLIMITYLSFHSIKNTKMKRVF